MHRLLAVFATVPGCVSATPSFAQQATGAGSSTSVGHATNIAEAVYFAAIGEASALSGYAMTSDHDQSSAA
jgi:hypothetical protein